MILCGKLFPRLLFLFQSRVYVNGENWIKLVYTVLSKINSLILKYSINIFILNTLRQGSPCLCPLDRKPISFSKVKWEFP